MGLPAGLLEAWQYSAMVETTSRILPDGCSDLIIRTWVEMEQGEERALSCFVAPLADRAYAVESRAGEVFIGYRFRPGAEVDAARLLSGLAAMRPGAGVEGPAVLGLIDACVRLDPRVEEALQAVAVARSIPAAAQSLGVSERTLERVVRAATGRAPVYWRNLARVRRAAAALGQAVPLAALAADYGFADQAHLCRAFQHWFGVSPGLFRADPALREAAALSGY